MRLIDADALKYKQQVMYKKDGSDDVWVEWFTTATEIANAPTIDAEPVVRCRDCKWFNRFGCAIEIVDFTDRPAENDYCSFGEREDDDRTDF